MALGGTGVASAFPSKAPYFNPALLSVPLDPDSSHFSLSTHAGARLFDRDGFIDGVKHYQDNNAQGAFDIALSEFNRHVDQKVLATEDFDRLSAATNELLDDIEGLSHRPLRGGGAVGLTIARPGRTGVAGFVRTYAVGGGVIDFASADRALAESTLQFGRSTIGLINLLGPYVAFVQTNSGSLQDSFESGGIDGLEQELQRLLDMSELADNSDELISLSRSYYDAYLASAVDVEDVEMLTKLPDFAEELQSSLELQGASVTEFGVSFSRRLDGWNGLLLGATLKIIQFDTFDFRGLIQDSTSENISYNDHRTQFRNANFDIGLSGLVTDNIRWGIVARNLVSRDYETIRGNIIELRPQVRVGFSWETENLSIVADLDLTRNEPLGFDADKRFMALGVEHRGSRWTWRGGLRHNIVDNTELYSLGTAVRIGRAQLELSAAGAKDTAALALQIDIGF